MNTKKLQKIGIGERIQIARKKLGSSSAKVSAAMDLSRSMCSQWERGISNPSTAHLVKLAKVLGVSFAWLATGGSEVEKVNKEKQINQEELKILKQTQLLKMTEEFNKMDLEQQEKLVDFLQVATKY
ncbi:helix-turn-helix domain-containing protein [Abyssogena phaseoliformis symbiont]|uniref:helix-turn-helix domain-containing protein n=1 Tax=Abyssogena phaseoliformis symbiont TaxID=596095 RepID=UPI00191632ED|nr:helix-turn-helix transcriptional regulator [Abyssogena phaseoliformis symbiont]MBW5289829.1 hypothetical protein [Candidatus Ruthia sp. Apha_13_S6]